MHAKSTSILGATVVAAIITLSGCYGGYSGSPATGYVELSSAPVDVALYPHTYYEGRTVYLVNDRWMYPDNNRWVYYRQEPPYLYQQRTYIRQAPPGAYGYPRGGYPRGGYPPGGAYPGGYQRGYPQPQPYPQTAPPAYPHRGPAGAPPAVRVQ